MISQTAEYALRAVVFLAQQNGSASTRQQIADVALVPIDYLTRVMQALAESGIVSIKRGPGGGYLLSKPKETITVLDVIASVDASPRIDQCPLGIVGHELLCPLHAKLDEAAAMVEKIYRESFIIDLINPQPPKRPLKRNQPCSFLRLENP